MISKWFFVVNGFIYVASNFSFFTMIMLFFVWFSTIKYIKGESNVWKLRDVPYLIQAWVLHEIMIATHQPQENMTTPFVLRLLVYEIILDLGHYIGHRFMHKYAMCCHKIHHRYIKPNLLGTFRHHPVDLLITNYAPHEFAIAMVPFTENEFALVLAYKYYTEIAGHSGLSSTTTSFPLCIWLPRLFGIGLKASDHEKHHLYGNCFYSKRFTLWDKIFKTN